MVETVDAVARNQTIRIEEFLPHFRNYNTHSPAQVAKIAGSLSTFGQVRSVVVWRNYFLAGHGVREAALSLGWETLRADVLPDEYAEERALAYVVADNEIARQSDPDQAALAALLQEVGQHDPALVQAAGFSAQELEQLLRQVGAAAGDEDGERQIEDFPVADLLSPYPWFGGKRGVAGAVWARFGEVRNYAEPFFGSGAVLLSRPNVTGIETVNDFDGFVANFWRAVAQCPDEVARYVDWPVNENDLFARHLWLVQQGRALTDALHTDPDYCDPKIAGWWCWGICNWIGGGWCDGDGPWRVEGGTVTKERDAGKGVNRKLPHLGNAGQGVNRQLPHLGDAGKGVNRKLPHLGDAGKGVNRQLPHLGDAGKGDGTDDQCVAWRDHLFAMMQRLSDRLRRVRVACGDWSRVVTSSVTERHGLTAVFLDPPYAEGAMEYSAGGNQDANIANAVRSWCVENGDNPDLRIAFCGYEPLIMPAGWTALRWTARKGYQNEENAANSRREIVWFSPHCLIAEAS